MSEDVIHGSDATFEAEVLKSEIPVLVDFWASWCGPCLMIAPVIDQLAATYKGKLKVVKLNVEENARTPQTYGVLAIPTLIMFKNGEPVEKSEGVRPKAKLIEFINKNL